VDARVPLDGGGASPLRPRRYDLVLREGSPRGLVWRYRDEGITLTPLSLEWTARGQSRSMPYSAITSIRLQLGHVPRSGNFGSCIVTFRDGLVLTIASVNRNGFPDLERAAGYSEFVEDLHARLGVEDRRRIAFLAGNSEDRHAFGWFAVILGGAFFVLLPLALLVVTGEAKALFITLAGAAFIYPVWRTHRRNEPRHYDPARLDEEVFPHV
jgi:hypothetical protein